MVDGLGSVILLTGEEGSVKNAYSYGARGEAQAVSETAVQPFAHTGREFAVLVSGPVDNHTTIGRGISGPDSDGFSARIPLRLTDPMTVYSYASNDPINWLDHFGLRSARTGDPIKDGVFQEKCIKAAREKKEKLLNVKRVVRQM